MSPTSGQQSGEGPAGEQQADAHPAILHGIRVLDFGRYIAGPFCAALLADMGAEVIRIEGSDGNDDRYVMPVTDHQEGALYLQMNRNKKSLTLNFSNPGSTAVLRRLIAQSDVVVANLVPAALKKLGLDYEALKQIKPDIILTSVSAFGPVGPDKNSPGFDGTGQAMSGAMYLTGMPGQPFRSAVSFVDYSTALASAFGTMAALLARRQSGHGQHVQASLLHTALTMTNPMLIEEASGCRSRVPTGNRSPISGPNDLFATVNGWVLVQVAGQDMFERWCRLLGVEELIGDARFTDDLRRGENGQLLSDIMGNWSASRTSEEVLGTLRTARIPGCAVLSPAQVLHQRQNTDDGMFDWQERAGLKGTVPIVRTPVRMSRVDNAAAQPAPALGEHTDSILQAMGFSAAEVAALRDDGIV
jgi:crotonobetainyl-CoA:carnitine CoA-transferase CaiB-like acyl-CoA transferase